VKSPYVYLIDDDNDLDPDFFERTIVEYSSLAHYDTALYSPTVGWRDTDRIQSVGMRRFHYRLGRAEPMLGGWKTKIFSLFH